MQKESLILSIDGGASSSKAGIYTKTSKKLIREYIGKPIYTEGNNIKQIILNIKEILLEVKLDFKELEGIVIGISGLDTKKEKLIYTDAITRLIKIYFNKAKIFIVNDIELLVKAIKDKTTSTIILIAGSGVNCVIVENGEIIDKSGGMGSVLSDQGGGYFIGKKALEASVKSWDGRGEKTLLEKEVLNCLNLKTFFELKEAVTSITFLKKEYASLSKIVLNCFEKNDKVSKKILQLASEELFLHVVAVAKKNKINNFNLILCGNIMKIAFIQENLKEYTKKYFKNSKVFLNQEKTFYGGVNYFN